MAKKRMLPHLNDILNIKKSESPKRIRWKEYSLKDTIFFGMMMGIIGTLGGEIIESKFLPSYIFISLVIVALNVARKYKRNASNEEINELKKQTLKIIIVEIVIWIIIVW